MAVWTAVSNLIDQSIPSGLWILEIQIAHPSEPFGAFYEDLLAR